MIYTNKMRFKCNSMDCETIFNVSTNNKHIEVNGCPKCPICNDYSGSYRLIVNREDMIKELIDKDIQMIRDGLANDDTEYLTNILMGNGWKQYNNLTDEEIRIEWEEDNE